MKKKKKQQQRKLLHSKRNQMKMEFTIWENIFDKKYFLKYIPQ